jgi:hypothetical protein
MLRGVCHQQGMDDFRITQKLEARHQRFYALLADIGIPRSTVDLICQVIQSGHGSPDDILVDAIKHASNDDSTLLAMLKPIVTDKRTPQALLVHHSGRRSSRKHHHTFPVGHFIHSSRPFSREAECIGCPHHSPSHSQVVREHRR